VQARRPTWLVTGATGFLGANLGAYLDGRAHRIGVRRAPSSHSSTYDAWVDADLVDPGEVARAIAQHRPDVVVHAAALASHEACEADPELADRVNAQSVGVLRQAAQDTGSRFVLISTDAVFDGASGHYAEADEPSPFSVYGRTKRAGELLALEDPGALVVRTNFFGWSPSGHRSILEFFVNELGAGRDVRGFTDFTVTSAYAQTLCDLLHRLVDLKARGLLHVTSSDAMTKYDFGVAVANEFGLDASLVTPTAADVQPPRNRDLSLDVSRVEALLGETLPTQQAGIATAHADAALRARLQG
jgi:dTDP-4-dehydrorhamnose reductase